MLLPLLVEMPSFWHSFLHVFISSNRSVIELVRQFQTSVQKRRNCVRLLKRRWISLVVTLFNCHMLHLLSPEKLQANKIKMILKWQLLILWQPMQNCCRKKFYQAGLVYQERTVVVFLIPSCRQQKQQVLASLLIPLPHRLELVF